MNIIHQPLHNLVPRETNPRTHSPKQVRQIAASIERFGFVNPILLDGHSRVIAGHGRLLAARQLELETVPTICIDHLNEDEIRAYVIADNKLAENAGWDDSLLSIELGELSELDIDLDVTITGFETGEIDVLIASTGEEQEAEKVWAPAFGTIPITQLGDAWQLGPHRIVCGDARDRRMIQSAVAGSPIRMVFTDPPYNVPIDGHVCGLGAIKHRPFPMASGEMSDADFETFLSEALSASLTLCADGALLFVFMDWRHATHLQTAAARLALQQKNLCVWAKDQPGMGSFYRSQHELVFVFKNGTAAHINNIQLGRHGRNRSNIWAYPGVSVTNPNSLSDLQLHPTVKPISLVADAILDASKRGELVLDPFGGSGTTLLAAERTGRRAALVELDPAYVDTAIQRWESETGGSALRERDGRTFTEPTISQTATSSDGEKQYV